MFRKSDEKSVSNLNTNKEENTNLAENPEQIKKRQEEEEYQKSQIIFQNNIKRFSELGYHQIFLQVDKSGLIKEFNQAHPLNKITPIDPYHSKNDVPEGERMGMRLFEKNGKIHSALLRSLTTNPNCPEPILAKNQQYIFVVVLKQVESSQDEGQYLLELRVNGGVKSGHPKLIRSIMIDLPQPIGTSTTRYKESESMLAAGEFYLMEGRCVLTNDKSGNFFDVMRARGIDPSILLDYFFKPFYTQENGFYPYLQDEELPPSGVLSNSTIERLDQKLTDELKKRGFVSAQTNPEPIIPISSQATTQTTTSTTTTTQTTISTTSPITIQSTTPISQTNTETTKSAKGEREDETNLLPVFTIFSEDEMNQQKVLSSQPQLTEKKVHDL